MKQVLVSEELLRQVLNDHETAYWPTDASKALRTALEQPVQGHVCDKDPQGCWNVRCQLGKKCKNAAPQAQQPNGWLRAVDEEMVSTHLGVADATDSYEDAKRKLNELICWHVDVSHDPKVNGKQPQLLTDDEIERLRKDAARYQWLKDRATASHVQHYKLDYPTTWHIVTGGSDTNIDAAIDAAMESK